MAPRRAAPGQFRRLLAGAGGRLAWPRILLVAGIVAVATGHGAPAGNSPVPGPVQARVLVVIDGDTIAVRARIWLRQDVETRVRLAGVDAPELRAACRRERALAQTARKRVADMIGGAIVSLSDIRQDKFGGRVLASVRTAAGDDLAALLIADGLARAYDGGARASWCGGTATGP